MYTPEEIQAINRQRAQAIFDRFETEEAPRVNDNLQKSEDTVDQFWTSDDLSNYRDDLFKSIDEGRMGDDDIEKAQSELQSLVESTRIVDGKEIKVYVKG